jgi:hypothetical protein
MSMNVMILAIHSKVLHIEKSKTDISALEVLASFSKCEFDREEAIGI